MVHYTEDVISPAYEQWYCRTIKEQTDPTIKEDMDFDKISKVYDGMVKVGTECQEAKKKKNDDVLKAMKNLTA